MGLWYRLSHVVVMGGSFIEHGGQNPLEPIRLRNAVVTGPHTFNFHSLTQELVEQQAIIQLSTDSADELAATLATLLHHTDQREELANRAYQWLEAAPPVAQKLTQALMETANA